MHMIKRATVFLGLPLIFSSAVWAQEAETTASDSETAQRLHLVCLGAGSANKYTSAQAQAWDNSGNSAWGTVVGNRAQPFEDQVNLWIEGDQGEIRMPRTMLPAIRGGKDGWFKIKSIEMTEGEIRASVGVNIINNPKLRIDRYTGAISLSGKAGDYSGVCQAYDPEAVKQKF